MRGTIREKFSTGSGSIARHILKQLEALKIVEKVPNGKGRRITPQGQRDLDSIAGQVGRPPSPPRPPPRRPPAPPAPGGARPLPPLSAAHPPPRRSTQIVGEK